LHPTFHVDKLSPWKGNEVNGMLPPPPDPIQIDEVDEWEVEEILDSRISTDDDGEKLLEYLVRWKGFGSEEDTWEPSENVVHSKRLVTRFHRLHPAAPRRIAATWVSLLWSIADAGP
jgi:aminopeptidase N